MKNSMIFLVLLFMVSALFSDNDIVPADVIEDIALRNAKALWGDVTTGRVIPYYYSDEEVVAYRYNFYKGDKFPDEPDIIANEGFCTMLLSARRDMPVILEHSETLSHEYLLGDKLRSMAENEVGKGFEIERSYYLSISNVWYCVINGGNKKYIRVLPPLKVLDEDKFNALTSSFSFFCERGDFSEEWDVYELGERELSRAEVLLVNHENMPFYSWHYGCSPTAASMLLAWYDYNSINTYDNYSNLVDFHYTEWDEVTVDVKDYHNPNTLYELANEMATDDSGSTDRGDIVPGILSVTNDLHDYEFQGYFYEDYGTTYYFNMVRDWVDDGLPLFTSIDVTGNHSVVSIGYNEANNTIGIHDPNVGEIDWISKSYIEGTHGIWADGGYGYSFVLQYPHGDLRRYPWGAGDNGEEYEGNDICEIHWVTDMGSAYDGNVTIILNKDSENTDLMMIAEGLPNTGYYWWQVPNNIDSDTCRVWIELYDNDGDLIGADGSYGDFEIHPGGSFEELTYDDRVTTTRDPDFYWFDHNEANWGVVGVRSNAVVDNWGLALFNDTDFSQVIKGSQHYTGNVNLIAIDGNHAPSPERGLRVAHYDNETTSYMASVEMEGEAGDNLTQGMNPQETWPVDDVCEIWDVWLTPSAYTITLDVLSGDANLDLGIFGSSPGNYYKDISELLTSSTNHGPGEDEAITVNITQADYYGVCVWALNESTAEFQINIAGPGTWDGSYSNNWNDSANWANGEVPDLNTDVHIPSPDEYNYHPEIVSYVECRNLVVSEDAQIDISGEGTMRMWGTSEIYGSILLESGTGSLEFYDNVHWYDGSHLTDSGSMNIFVRKDWTADDGSFIHLTQSDIQFNGNQDSNILINAYYFYVKDLLLNKIGTAEVVFDEDSSEKLKVNDLYVIPPTTFRVLTEAPVEIHNDLLSISGTIIFEVGSLNFVGSECNMWSNSASDFCEIYIDEDASLSLSGASDIRLHAMLNYGVLNIALDTIEVTGGWFNTSGEINSSGSTVIFNGEGNQSVNEADFETVELDKPYGGELVISNGNVLNCESFNYTSGTIRVNGGSFAAEDLADTRVMGNYILDGGSIDLHQGTTSSEYVDLDANIWIYDGTFNIYGGYPTPSEWAYTRNITVYMEGGILDFKDNGIFISDTGHELTDIITGGSIRTSGDFKVDTNGFYPAGGQIELYGGGTAYCYNNPGSSFRNVRVNKGSSTREDEERDRLNRVIFNNDTTIDQDLIVDSGFIQINDISLTIGDDLSFYGGLNMDSEDDRIYINNRVRWYNGSNATVDNGEFHVGGNWMFYNGIDCEFEQGNVVYFDGNANTTISSYSTTACFGDVKIDKETGVTQVHSYNNNTVQISGDLEVLSDNTFDLNGNDLAVDGMIDLYTDSQFIMDNGAEVTTTDLFMQGSLLQNGGNLTISDNFVQYTSGSLTIEGGNFINDMPYTGSYGSFTGEVILNDGNLQISNNGIQFGEDTDFLQSGGTLTIGWGFRAPYPGTFHQDEGTIEFGGSLNCQIICAANNWFNEVMINKSGTTGNCQMSDPITINGNLTILDGMLSTDGNQLTVWKSINIGSGGILDADEGLVLVGENWNNEHGAAGFVEAASTVRFFNYLPGEILFDETFYNMTILKDTAPNYYLEIPEGNTVHVLNNLHISDGTLMMHTDSSLDVDRDIIIEDDAGLNCYFLDENTTINIGRHWYDYNDEISLAESFIRGQSTVIFDGESNQVVEATRELYEFENIVINQTAEYFYPHSNFMIVGNLEIINGCWNNSNMGMTHYLSGNVSICDDGWWDNMGTVIFYSSREATFERLGSGVQLHNVIIDKNPAWGRDETREPAALTLASDLIMPWGGDLTIESGTLMSADNTISCSGNVTINGGILAMDADSRLRVGNECALNVNAGGTLQAIGTEEYPVDITSYNTGHYHEVNINTDGDIKAEHTTFQYMNTNGVYVTYYGTVDEDYAFNHCTFQNGIENGYLLRLHNDQEFVCNEAVFPENTWGSAYNVYRNRNAGDNEFINASGEFSGENYDYDPYNRIDWTIIAPPEIIIYADDPMEFGEVIIGEYESLGIDIQNTGDLELTGTITVPEGYTVSLWSRDNQQRITNRNALDFSVEGGVTHTYRVDFEPSEVMTYAGEIMIEHNADSAIEIVNVTGIGIPILPPTCEIWEEEFIFGDVIINESKTKWFTIYNYGGSALEGTIAVPEGYTVDEAAWRSIDNPDEEHHRETMNTRNVIGLEIEPGYMVNFSLVFEPVELQEYNGVLAITHNAPSGETLIDITGRGVEAILSYNPYVLSSVLTPGETDTQFLILGNEGNLDIDYQAYIEYENVNNTIIEEGFEGDFPPTGWNIDPEGWGGWMQSSQYFYAGDYSAQISAMDGDDTRLITPWFTSTDDCLLRYWIMGNSDFWDEFAEGEFHIELTTNGNDWTPIYSCSQEILPEDWAQWGLSLGAYAGQNVRLAFHVTANFMARGVNIDEVKITGETNPTYSWLMLNGDTYQTGNIPVNGLDEEIQVSFNSAGLQDNDYYANIYLVSNDTSDPVINIPAGFNVGVYDLTVTPVGLDFGAIDVWTESTMQFTLENTGSLELDGEILAPDGFYVYENSPVRRDSQNREPAFYHLFPDDSIEFNVTFSPGEFGNYDGDISISNIWTDAIEYLSVSGTGLASEIDTSDDMLNVEQSPGNSTTRTLTLSNNGNDTLEYSANISFTRNNRDILVSTGFENEFPPAGWDTDDFGMAGNWWWDNFYPHTGMVCAVADPYMTVDARLISPQFTATPDCQLSYFIRTYNQPAAGGSFGVEVSLDGNSWTFLEEIDMSTLSLEYEQRTVSLAEYSGSNINIAFRMYDNTNYYCAGILLDDVEITGNPVVLDEWLTLDGEESVAGIIEPGNSSDILVGFDAMEIPEGYYMSEIEIDSNDPITPQQSIMAEMIVGYPHISVFPDSIDFWDIAVGEELWQNLYIENMGDLTLTGEISVPDGFTVLLDSLNIFRETGTVRNRSIYPFEIDPWMNQNCYVIFSPEAAQSYDGELVITHNAPEDEIHIPLVGQGCGIPEVITAEITEITEYSAIGGGVVIHDGNNTINTRGICWNTDGNPVLEMDMFTVDGDGLGEFVSEMQTLMPGTTYYVRAYATNYYGCAYGEEVTFVTVGAIMNVSVEGLPDFGNVGIGACSNEVSYTVSGTGLVDDIMIFAPMGFQVAIDNLRNLEFTDMLNIEQVDGEIPETIVYVRFCPNMITEYIDSIVHYTMNSQGRYVEVMGTGVVASTVNISVMELPDFGEVQVGMASTSAIYSVSGINLLGNVVIIAPAGFEISLTSDRGLLSRSVSRNNREFTSELILVPENGVLDETEIFAQFVPEYPGDYMNYIVHQPEFGEPELLFVSGTGIALPEVETSFITGINYIFANGGGEVISDGNLEVNARGVCWSTDPEPDLEDEITVDGNGMGSFISYLGNLNEGTSYYVRAYATSSIGTAYGNQTIFITLSIPEIDIPDSLSFNEDEFLEIDFEPYLYDADYDPLILTVTGNTNVNIAICGFMVTFSAADNWFGSEILTFAVSDNVSRAIAIDEVEIIVTSVNDVPTIELPDNLTFIEDGLLEVDFVNFVDDVDAEDLVLTVIGGSNIIAEINGLNVTFTATENWFGSETLTFTIDDQQSRATASDDVEIIVTSVNDQPIADAGDEYIGQADVTGFCEIMLNGTGSYDIDGEIISWLWSWVGGNAEGEEVLAEFASGTTEVTLTITDNEAGVDTDITQVIVSSYDNLAPVAIADEYLLNEDTGLSDNVMANDYDPDESPLALIAELISDVSNGTLNLADNGDFTYLPDPDWNGTDAFDYRVYDGAAYSVTVTVNLIVVPVNDAPTIELPDSFTFAEDGLLEVDFANYVNDVDNMDLVLTVTGGSNITADINGLNVTFTATENWFGNEILTFTIDDQQSRNTDADTLIVNVLPDLDYGDIDDTGMVDCYDAALVLRYIVGLDPIPEDPIPWEEWRFLRADVNINGQLEAMDAAYILQFVVAIINELPVNEPVRNFENLISFTNDQKYIYLSAEEELFALHYSITTSENLKMGETEIIANDCLHCTNNNQLALISAYGLKGNILRIPYQIIDQNTAEIRFDLESNGFYHQIEYAFTETVPEASKLTAVYPNPFNPETTITYELTENTHIIMEIYNIKGQKMVTLIDEKQIPGIYNLNWNAKNRPSGIYYLSLKTSTTQNIRKIVLLK